MKDYQVMTYQPKERIYLVDLTEGDNMINTNTIKFALQPMLRCVKQRSDSADGRVVFEVEPGKMYPAAIKDINTTRIADNNWTGVQHLDSAVRHLPARGWELAINLQMEVEPDEESLYNNALELARLWFTEKLHQAINHAPMKLVIKKDLRWRLFD
jgi:hypothetical protein